MKTRTEVEELKLHWRSDPCWDIEDSEGFEAYHDELKAYSEEWQKRWQTARLARLLAKAEEIGVPGNTKLAEYIMALEERLAKLEERLEKVFFRE